MPRRLYSLLWRVGEVIPSVCTPSFGGLGRSYSTLVRPPLEGWGGLFFIIYMSATIKCPNCKTWNEGKDYCSNCNQLLNFKIQREQTDFEKEIARKNRPKDKIDLYFLDLKNSPIVWKQRLYMVFQGIGILFFLFATAMIAIVAFTPG